MRRIFKLILVTMVVAGFVFSAGTAFAQDDKGYVRIIGYVSSHFGQVTFDPGTVGSDSIS